MAKFPTTSYRDLVTTVEALRVTVGRAACEVPVAGVLWPAYKLYALAVGVLILVVGGVGTARAAPAVLSAAGATALVWLFLRTLCASCR